MILKPFRKKSCAAIEYSVLLKDIPTIIQDYWYEGVYMIFNDVVLDAFHIKLIISQPNVVFSISFLSSHNAS